MTGIMLWLPTVTALYSLCQANWMLVGQGSLCVFNMACECFIGLDLLAASDLNTVVFSDGEDKVKAGGAVSDNAACSPAFCFLLSSVSLRWLRW